ncbi:MAG: hypothetical protein ACUVQ4_08800, partial [bacterium]
MGFAEPQKDGWFIIDTNVVYQSSPYNQQSSDITFDSINFLVVWEDNRALTNYDIYGCRVSTSGSVLEPNGILISGTTNIQENPSVVGFDHTNFFVVWEDYRNNTSEPDIYATRVNQTDTVLNPLGIAISTSSGSQMTPAVA